MPGYVDPIDRAYRAGLHAPTSSDLTPEERAKLEAEHVKGLNDVNAQITAARKDAADAYVARQKAFLDSANAAMAALGQHDVASAMGAQARAEAVAAQKEMETLTAEGRLVTSDPRLIAAYQQNMTANYRAMSDRAAEVMGDPAEMVRQMVNNGEVEVRDGVVYPSKAALDRIAAGTAKPFIDGGFNNAAADYANNPADAHRVATARDEALMTLAQAGDAVDPRKMSEVMALLNPEKSADPADWADVGAGLRDEIRTESMPKLVDTAFAQVVGNEAMQQHYDHQRRVQEAYNNLEKRRDSLASSGVGSRETLAALDAALAAAGQLYAPDVATEMARYQIDPQLLASRDYWYDQIANLTAVSESPYTKAQRELLNLQGVPELMKAGNFRNNDAFAEWVVENPDEFRQALSQTQTFLTADKQRQDWDPTKPGEVLPEDRTPSIEELRAYLLENGVKGITRPQRVGQYLTEQVTGEGYQQPGAAPRGTNIATPAERVAAQETVAGVADAKAKREAEAAKVGKAGGNTPQATANENVAANQVKVPGAAANATVKAPQIPAPSIPIAPPKPAVKAAKATTGYSGWDGGLDLPPAGPPAEQVDKVRQWANK